MVEDDPRLDVRLVDTPRQPHLVLVDSHLQTPPGAKVFIPGREVWIYAANPNDARADALRARGATISYMANAQGKVDLAAMLDDLAAREVNEVHAEAGHKLNGSLLREGLVDELLVYLAPKLIGEGLDIASRLHPDGPLASLDGAVPLEFRDVALVGPDLRVLARLAGRGAF